MRGIFILIDNLDALSVKNKGVLVSLFIFILTLMIAYA